MRIVFIVLFGIITKSASMCDSEYSVELTKRMHNGVMYNEGEYFVDNVSRVEKGCVCMKEICARKCCPLGQGYDFVEKQCVNLTEPFKPPVYKNYRLIPDYNATKEMHFLFGKMNCSAQLRELRVPIGPAAKQFHLKKDGTLFVQLSTSLPSMTYGPDKYCIDTFIIGDKKELNALVCFVTKPEKNNYRLSSTCMLISCFFILLTVAVYAWLPELRNLHGMVLMAYLLSFFVGFLYLAIMQILILRGEIKQVTCTSFTFVVYFSLLSAFFWLNVMCYDIWWTFSGKRAQVRGRSTKKRFLYYCAYAFGVPTALTILLATLEFSGLPQDNKWMPRLQLQGCFLYGTSKLIYLYGPIVILCVANMTFFTLTAFKIAKIRRDTAMLQAGDNSTNDHSTRDTQRFTLYVKLFIVMGINWILEVVSSFYPDLDIIWQFTDAYNILVGVIIFIIFVCKKKTWKMIKKRYAQLRGQPISRTQTTTSTSTRTLSSRDDLQMNSIKKT